MNAAATYPRPGFLRLGILLLLQIGCDQETADGSDVPARSVEDELALNDVWHQAKLRGVAFRAIGQEPGWLLEITNGQEILLLLDYGQTRVSMPWVEPVVYQQERRTEYLVETHDTVVEIRGDDCTDIMSGEQFPVTVEIRLGDRRLRGCGRALF